MAVLYDGLLVSVMQTVSSSGNSLEVTGIPWETFGAGTLHVTIELKLKSLHGLTSLYAYIAPSGLDDSGHTRPFGAAAVATMFAFHGTTFGDPPDFINLPVPMDGEFPTPAVGYVEFTGTGAPMSIYFWVPVLPPSFYEDSYTFFDAHVVVEGDAPPSLTVEITDPPEGGIEPGDALTFVVENDGLPDVLTADVTLSDGTVERAWESDQAVNGYSGTLAVDGTTRSYTISRPIGWPLGAVHLAVHVEAGDDEADDEADWTAAGATDAKDRVIIQYRESTSLLADVNLNATLTRQIEDVLRAIPPLDDPADAEGDNLDVTAELVGQGRDIGDGTLATDDQLRVLIGARITRNTTHVSAAEYLASLVQFFEAVVRLTDLGGMYISYVVMREPTDAEVALLNQDIIARPMGVRVSRSWAPTDYFGFAADPNALGFDEGHFPEGF